VLSSATWDQKKSGGRTSVGNLNTETIPTLAVGYVACLRRWRCLAPTLTVCDLVIMIMGQLASFGLPGSEGPAAKLEAA
jgi:hypothetical protein